MAVMLYWTIPPLYDRMAVLLYWIMTALGYTNINAFNCTGADTMHCVVTTGCTSSYRIQSILCCHNRMHVIVSYSISIVLSQHDARHRIVFNQYCVVTTGCTSSYRIQSILCCHNTMHVSYRIQSILCCHNTMHVIVSYSISIVLSQHDARHRIVFNQYCVVTTRCTSSYRIQSIFHSSHGIVFYAPIDTHCAQLSVCTIVILGYTLLEL